MNAILCFGDSITYGRGEQPARSWVGRLKQDFEIKDKYNVVYNLGIPGDTSTKLLKRIETEIKNRVHYIREDDKFTIIISIGINDSIGILTPKNIQTKEKQFIKNINELIEISKKYTPNIILLSQTPVNEKLVCPYENTYFSNEMIKKYNQIIEEVSNINKLKYIDIFNPILKLNYIELLEDGVHFNSKGYNEMYKIIKDELNI
ncbi:MAG: hypothetical protein HRU03_03610 [Nanoarchaeales archaeon]|nr:hypothetical protein [Nanoarchaeales archaeon]